MTLSRCKTLNIFKSYGSFCLEEALLPRNICNCTRINHPWIRI